MKRKTESPEVPAAGEGKRGEQGHLGYLLRQAGGAMRNRMERALAEYRVTQAQFVVLTMIGAYPGLSNADLARLAVLTPQTVNGIVANLKRSGAIASRPHPVHGRIQQLSLTAKGTKTLARCKLRVQGVESEIAAGLTAEQERTIRQWLVRMAVDHSDTKRKSA
ncbi:MAG TPA: MarR family transcriptional regulator [Magnetospirillaceae bacterium]|jgi:DNA-binding MarR family transcriptional regulator